MTQLHKNMACWDSNNKEHKPESMFASAYQADVITAAASSFVRLLFTITVDVSIQSHISVATKT